MFKVNFSHNFRKFYQKRVIAGSSLEQKYRQRFELFVVDPKNPILKDHGLTGKLSGYRAFWITGDVRVVYFLENDGSSTFVNIGSHNQVYGS